MNNIQNNDEVKEKSIYYFLLMSKTQKKIVLILSFLFLCLFIWMIYAPIKMVVRASGRVIPYNNTQLIQHLEGGVIESIDVSEGEHISKGMLLARINNITANSFVNGLKVKIAALKAKIQRLKIEINSNLEINDNVNLTLDAYLKNTSDFTSEKESFILRKKKILQELNSAQNQINQKKADLDELNNRQLNIKQELDLAKKQFEIYSKMRKKDAISEFEYLEAESKVQKLKTLFSSVTLSIPRIKAEIAVATSNKIQIIDRFHTDANAELVSATTELDKTQEELISATDRLKRTNVIAPVSGTINRIYFSTIGGVVKPGETIVELTPDNDKIIIEANVKPADRAELVVGLPVYVWLSAYNYASYGTAKGILTEISSDTVPNDRGERFYRIKVSLNTDLHPFANKPILPGMIAEVEIVIGQRTIAKYIISPLNRFVSSSFSEPN